jgi:hypothetical protein
MIAKVDLAKLLQFGAQCERRGITYGYGAKASHLSDTPDMISRIDCSGFSRWALFHATDGALILPDGSQAQREWCEQKAKAGELHQVSSYVNAARYMNNQRLFICFIKPFANGCGSVGHVFFLLNTDADFAAETLESCGGRGVCSRPWDTGVLRREFYNAFELPTKSTFTGLFSYASTPFESLFEIRAWL